MDPTRVLTDPGLVLPLVIAGAVALALVAGLDLVGRVRHRRSVRPDPPAPPTAEPPLDFEQVLADAVTAGRAGRVGRVDRSHTRVEGQRVPVWVSRLDPDAQRPDSSP